MINSSSLIPRLSNGTLNLLIAYQRLLNTEEIPFVPRLTGMPSLIGRANEWEILKVAWQNISVGQGLFVLITGEAGIGKSRQAEEMIGWADRQGIPASIAHCGATEDDLL